MGYDTHVGGLGPPDAAGAGVNVHQFGFRGQYRVSPIEKFLKGVRAHGQDEVNPAAGRHAVR